MTGPPEEESADEQLEWLQAQLAQLPITVTEGPDGPLAELFDGTASTGGTQAPRPRCACWALTRSP